MIEVADPTDLGEFTVGEIPIPLEVTFKTKAGVVIPITEARWVFARAGAEPVTREAEVDEDAGKATYPWVEGDLDAPGVYEGEMWATDGTIRPCSERYEWVVRPAVTVPVF